MKFDSYIKIEPWRVIDACDQHLTILNGKEHEEYNELIKKKNTCMLNDDSGKTFIVHKNKQLNLLKKLGLNHIGDGPIQFMRILNGIGKIKGNRMNPLNDLL